MAPDESLNLLLSAGARRWFRMESRRVRSLQAAECFISFFFTGKLGWCAWICISGLLWSPTAFPFCIPSLFKIVVNFHRKSHKPAHAISWSWAVNYRLGISLWALVRIVSINEYCSSRLLALIFFPSRPLSVRNFFRKSRHSSNSSSLNWRWVMSLLLVQSWEFPVRRHCYCGTG
jgi:hypothetical protein